MDWTVALTGEGSLSIERGAEQAADPLPFSVQPERTALAKTSGLSEVDFRGERHVLPVADGFIVGFDAGEFGGRVFWFSKDGANRKLLSPFSPSSLDDYHAENVHALVRAGRDVLAFEGSAHLTLDEGRVIRLHPTPAGAWQAVVAAELPGVPETVVEERAGTWLVITPTGIFRFHEDGRTEPVWTERELGALYPHSSVRLPGGTVFVGMRYFVLRLQPRGTAYGVDVLVPPSCGISLCACHRSSN